MGLMIVKKKLRIETMDCHFTATAFVIDIRKEKPQRTLFLWHKRLQRWMPPGGHMEPNELPEETAKRECEEETGLDVDIIGDAQANVFVNTENEGRMLKKPFTMLLENIPASEERGETAHQHMDFVFLARPINIDQVLNMNEHEAEEMKWFTKQDIENLPAREIYDNVRMYALEIFTLQSYMLFTSNTSISGHAKSRARASDSPTPRVMAS